MPSHHIITQNWKDFLLKFWSKEVELPLYAVCTTFAICKNTLFIHIAHALTTIQKAYFNTWFVFQMSLFFCFIFQET